MYALLCVLLLIHLPVFVEGLSTGMGGCNLLVRG